VHLLERIQRPLEDTLRPEHGFEKKYERLDLELWLAPIRLGREMDDE
jgi:hypothetical protein